MLEVRDIEVCYGDFQVLWGVSMRVAAGEVVCVLGPNGAGKSTVMNAVTGLIPRRAGSIAFDGQDLAGVPIRVSYGTGKTPSGMSHTGARVPVAAIGPTSDGNPRDRIEQRECETAQEPQVGVGEPELELDVLKHQSQRQSIDVARRQDRDQDS